MRPSLGWMQFLGLHENPDASEIGVARAEVRLIRELSEAKAKIQRVRMEAEEYVRRYRTKAEVRRAKAKWRALGRPGIDAKPPHTP